MQPSLFETSTQIVVDDERGTISYFPNAVSAAVATAWFANLRERVKWRSERRMMYDREVDVPRLVAAYWLDDPHTPDELAAAAAVARRLADFEFNSAGLNLYRDGDDSVAPHSDKLHELVAGAPIALLSLGAARRMTIQTKSVPRRSIHLDLDPGSVLIMSHATQRHFDHGIPKVRADTGPRISVAFRRRPSVPRVAFGK